MFGGSALRDTHTKGETEGQKAEREGEAEEVWWRPDDAVVVVASGGAVGEAVALRRGKDGDWGGVVGRKGNRERSRDRERETPR